MKKFLFYLLLLILLSAGFSSFVRAGAGPVGSIYLDPTTGNQALNQNFSVAAGVNVGANNKVNVVRATITAASTLTIVSCTAASGFQGIAGQNPCTISGSTAQVVVQSVNAEGPSAAVTFANLTLKGTSNGTKTATFSSPEIVVKQSNGQSVMYQLTSTVNGSYQIGSGSTNPSPTAAPGGTDQYIVPIGTKDQLTIQITGGSVLSPTPTIGVGPTPTGIVSSGPQIRFAVKLFGVQNTPEITVRLAATDLITQLTPVPGQPTFGCEAPGVGEHFYTDLAMVADGNGVYTPKPGGSYIHEGTVFTIDPNGWVALEAVPQGTPIALAVKGPLHRNVKMVDTIVLTSATPASQDFDWTANELEPGDLTDPNNSGKQDCTVNSVDLSLAISRLASTDQANLDVADVNFDGVVNGNDIAKIVNTLSTKPDDDR